MSVYNFYDSNKYLLLFKKDKTYILINRKSEYFNKICNYFYSHSYWKAFKYLSKNDINKEAPKAIWEKWLSGEYR